MITLKIDKPNKCNGDYSIFVSFPYNMEIINAIRELPTRYWINDTKEWEVPFKKLEDLVYMFGNKYQIAIVTDYPQCFAEDEEVDIPKGFEFKTKPFNHQIEGFKYGLNHSKWLLGDEQGCVSGESKVVIKEQGKPATRKTKIRNLKKAFDLDSTIQIKCLVNGRFAYMPIKAVVDKGVQPTIKITLNDTSIECTADHLIYTEKGWVEAGKLAVGDKIFTNGKQVCPNCGTDENLITYEYSKFLGYCKKCMYKMRDGKRYSELTRKIDKDGYVRLFGIKTRSMPNYENTRGWGIYEHHQVWYENTGHIVDTKTEAVHHKNGIKSDNRFENLQLMTIHEHAMLHSEVGKNHLYQFNPSLDYIDRCGTRIYLVPRLQEIVSIEESKEQQVWDIAIDDDEIHNFICNNIVVHNCGKTKQVLDISVAEKLLYGYKHCLIICGVNGLKWNWKNEVETHTNESAYILGQRFRKNGKMIIGSVADRLEDAENLEDIEEYFIITNVETLRDERVANALNEHCKSGNIGLVAADECHKMKNANSQQGKGLLKIHSDNMIAMTGTPLMNHPLDLYMIFKWLGYEKHSFYAFRNHHCIMGGFGGHEIIGYKNLDELQEQLNDIMLRRRKEDVLDLPEKTIIDEYVEMTPKQAKIYKEILNDIKENIDQITLAPNPLTQIIRLRQATGYTGILSSTIQESAKFDRMEEIIEDAIDNNRKVIIFSNWTQMTDAVEDRLRGKYNIRVITGQTSDVDRQSRIDDFQTNPNVQVMVGSIGALGTGVTMTAASVMIFLDIPWNEALYSQSVDRFHRIGQNNNVTVYNLTCRDTVDERILEIVRKKGAMSSYIVDGSIVGNKKELVNYLLN